MSKNKNPMYYIYHVPGIKVGMTKNLGSRVFEQQGYAPEEVELLFVSRDMHAASVKEIEYQKLYGYSIDRESYKDLVEKQKTKKKKMNKGFKINVTDMTTTFPCYQRELAAYLMDNRNNIIEFKNGEKFVVNDNLIDWCKNNAKTSMYTNDRCYVYNKALAKAMKEGMPPSIVEAMGMEVNYEYVTTSCGKCIFPTIRSWAHERGLYEKGDVKTQYVKLQEEAGEVARAIIKNDIPELKDGIGDMVVVLTNLAHLAGLEIEDCIQSAYDVISKRKGSMINGSFVKNETL
jgi:phosphoribosyl-ATP pyrophosphohydrolase